MTFGGGGDSKVKLPRRLINWGGNIPAQDEVYLADNYQAQLQQISTLNCWFKAANTTSKAIQLYATLQSGDDTDKFLLFSIGGSDNSNDWYNWRAFPMKMDNPSDGKIWLTELRDQDNNVTHGSINLGAKPGTSYLYEIANTGTVQKWFTFYAYSYTSFNPREPSAGGVVKPVARARPVKPTGIGARVKEFFKKKR